MTPLTAVTILVITGSLPSICQVSLWFTSNLLYTQVEKYSEPCKFLDCVQVLLDKGNFPGTADRLWMKWHLYPPPPTPPCPLQNLSYNKKFCCEFKLQEMCTSLRYFGHYMLWRNMISATYNAMFSAAMCSNLQKKPLTYALVPQPFKP